MSAPNRIDCTYTSILECDQINFSSHCPIHIEIHCDMKYKAPTENCDKISPFDLPIRINWKQGNIEAYRSTLGQCLMNVNTENIKSDNINQIISGV